jgi:hypothetical protein
VVIETYTCISNLISCVEKLYMTEVLCVVLYFLCFACLRHVSCVSNVASDCGLSILHFPFGFL